MYMKPKGVELIERENTIAVPRAGWCNVIVSPSKFVQTQPYVKMTLLHTQKRKEWKEGKRRGGRERKKTRLDR